METGRITEQEKFPKQSFASVWILDCVEGNKCLWEGGYLWWKRKENGKAVSVRYLNPTGVPGCCRKVIPFQHCTGVSKIHQQTITPQEEEWPFSPLCLVCGGALDAGYARMVFLAAWQMQLPRLLSNVIAKSYRFVHFGITFKCT